MRQFKLLLLLSIFAFSCKSTTQKTYQNEIVFFMQSDNVELLSDYEYHIGNIIDLYKNKDIKITKLEERNYINGNINIKIDNNESFAMILVDKKGNYKTHFEFGTDVDLMIIINAFFIEL